MKTKIAYITLGITLLIVQFQNCSDVKFSSVAEKVVETGNHSLTQDFPFVTPGSLNKVDILLVDDNSGSMADRQKSLAEKFPQFISLLDNLDWQLAITTTDVCDPASTDSLCTDNGIVLKDAARGRFLNPLGSAQVYGDNIMKRGGANVADVFAKTVQRADAGGHYEQGSGDERGVYAANLVVDAKDSFAAALFRPNSNFAIIILSDEDERSVGGQTNNNQKRDLESYDLPETLIKKVSTAFNKTKSLLVNSIIVTPTDNNCSSHTGTIYNDLSLLTGGYIGSICNVPYDDSLTGIAGALQDQNTGLVLNLLHTPTSAPTVTFEPAANSVQYIWSGRKITLGMRPASGTTVHVTYSY
jgi:hypothetical protein